MTECEASPICVPCGVVAPPPSRQDYHVSLVGGPDWNPDHFSGGVEMISRRGDLLIFHFTAGGQICVDGGVTYVAPEAN